MSFTSQHIRYWPLMQSGLVQAHSFLSFSQLQEQGMFTVLLFWERGLLETTFKSLDEHTTEVNFVLHKENWLAIICQMDIRRKSIINSWI